MWRERPVGRASRRLLRCAEHRRRAKQWLGRAFVPPGAPLGVEAPPGRREYTAEQRLVNWRRALTRVIAEVERHVDTARYDVKGRIPGLDPIQIVPYHGYGTAHRVLVLGRVLEDKRLRPALASDPAWRNVLAMLKRLESEEIPFARVRVRLAGAERELVADDEGYFSAWLEPARPLERGELWHRTHLELAAPLRRGAASVSATGRVFVPPPSAEIGVISDLDDTVIRTNATSLVRMARATIFGNARTRLPFPGVAAFYRALHAGVGGFQRNPLFYVSSSPWNLFDLLSEFLYVQKIPTGPLLLRDWGVGPQTLLPTDHRSHKLEQIRQILDTFAPPSFILIGDSGQKDPEIYREIVHAYPERIAAVYIRNVSRRRARSEEIGALADEMVEAGSTLVLADDTLAAARHAAEHGWIAPKTLAGIDEEKRLEEPPDIAAPTLIVDGDSHAPS